MKNRAVSRRSRMTVRAAGLVLVTGLAAAALPVQSASAQVQWRTGTGATPKKETASGLSRLLMQMSSRADKSHVVAHFNGALTDAQKTQLKQAGLELLDYVGNNAYFAKVTPGVDAARISAAGVLLTVEEINTTWKLHPDLHAGIIRGWTVVDGLKDFDLPRNGEATQTALQARGLDPSLSTMLMLHADVSQDDAARLVERLGGAVIHRFKTINALHIWTPMSKVRDLAASDLIRFLEPAMPPLTTCNDDNRVRTATDTVHAAPYGLSGAGVDVLVYDGGTIGAHSGLAPRITNGDSSGTSSHATHVAGTIGGTGAGEAGNPHRGMAPGLARFFGYGVQGFGNDFFRNAVQTDTENDYLAAIAAGADVANNSVGNNIESNGYPCEFQGDYGTFSEMLDSLIRGERPGQNAVPFRTVWAAGNERQGSRCNIEPNGGSAGFYSIAPPQAGKNQICVGAVNSNDDSIASFTSWGPTDDGRLKPDFCAPGCQSNGDGGVTSCSGASGYASLCGTSMASPTACGIAALFIEDWRRINSGMPDPLNSTIKCIFAHTAIDLDDPGPDYKTGFGSIRSPRIIDQLRSGNYIENQVGQGQVYTFVVIVSPTDTQFKATIVWDDFRGNAAVSTQLVNDLDMVVTAPNGTRYYPWTLNPLSPDSPAVQTQEDHLNNIEQVFVQNPIPGGWTVAIRGTNVPQGPQRFSVAASPLLVNCSDAGSTQLDREKYSCAATSATLRVVDCGLNTSDSVIDTTTVVVRSTTDTTGEVVTLTETAAESAAFLGSVPLSTSNTPGSLQIAAGDTITLVYIDADNGSGGSNVMVTDTAAVDCTGPVITNVNNGPILPRSASVTFTTNENAQGRVRWGTSCGALTNTSDPTPFGTSHSVSISGLMTNTTYFYAVDATDEAANSSSNDNGGACYTFTTPAVPEFYTEQFTGSHDIGMRQITFTPGAGGGTFYNACGTTASALPTSPTGGAVVAQGDDTNTNVTLSGGATVSLYGVSYNNFFIGSNGYVTFTAGDTTYSESLGQHFALPRVSGWFDDLIPSSGQCTWRQLADRAAITWLNCPHFSSGEQNTFQIELFFDGRIRITWLAMNSTTAVVGLSRGGGQDPDFFPSDLSAIGCGPRPPTATGASVAVITANNLNVQLTGEDDGVPSPLTYIITQLPAHGRLRDAGTGNLITSAPFALASNGRNVIYRPLGTYIGADSFQFRVNDGGTPPAGGDSNIATISVAVNPVAATVQFEFLVNDQNPNWTTQGLWAFGVPTGGGSFNRDPTTGFTGNNVLGYNLAGNYTNSINPPLYLTSTAMNLSGRIQTRLEFRRWLGIDASANDNAAIQVSTNGTTWNNVWVHSGAAISENAWSLQSVDLSAFADNQAAVRLRWAMGTTNATVVYPGWNLDDIRVFGLVPTPVCPCDWNGSGQLNSQDFFDFLTDLFAANADYNADGITNSQDFFDFITCFFAACP